MLLALVLAAALSAAPDEQADPRFWSAPQDSQAAPRVSEIVFEGAEPESVRALVELQAGSLLDGRDVRDAVRALHASARFSRVAAYVEPIAVGAVRLVFVLTPVQKLVSVTFPGHQELAESILHQTANLQVNAEFQPEQIPGAVEAVRAAYFRIGYRAARVTPVRKVVPGGAAVELHIEEGPATVVSEIRFDGDVALDQGELDATFKLQPGDVLNLGALDDGVKSVRDRYRKAGRLRARVDAPRVEELGKSKARLVVPVEAGPLVRFHVRGNRAFSDGVLVAHLGAENDEVLDAQAAQDMAGRLRRFYITAGFLYVKVAQREMRAADGAVELVFTVDEGSPVRVERLAFTGNTGIPTAQLMERLLLQLRDNVPRDPAQGADPADVERLGLMGSVPEPHDPRTKVEPDKVFDPVLYQRALKQIEDLYKSQGYLSVKAGPPKLDRIGGDPNRLDIGIPIVEGQQSRVGKLIVEGDGDAPRAEVDQAIVLRVGQPFSFLQAEEGRAALTQIFTRRGHLYARVEDDEEFVEGPDGQSRVDVRYRIQPGPVVKVGFVEVVGQRRTVESLVLNLVGLRPGDVLTPEVLDRGQQALLRTGLFFSATLTPRNPEVAESEKTVQVQLRERPTRDFQASLGFSLADGPRATAQYTQGNLFGRNLTFSAVGKADYPIWRFSSVICPAGVISASQCETQYDLSPEIIERVLDFGLSVPRLYPFTDALRASVDLIHERAVRASYRFSKYSSQVGVELTRRRPFTAGLAYEFGFQQLEKGVQSVEDALAGLDRNISRLPNGQMLFGSLRPTAVLDLRDDPARPRAGFLLQLNADYLRSYTGGDTTTSDGVTKVHVNLIRAQGLAAGYVPLPFLSSIVFSARGGRIFALDSQSLTPGDRRFYLGGSTSLRGFHEDAVQPQDLITQLHSQVRSCEATLTDLGCTREAVLLQAGVASDGGDVFMAFGAELRIPLAQSIEVALFWDSGNLWDTLDGLTKNPFVLRHAVGSGLRWLTPIGRMAIDIGVNLAPDSLLGEPSWGPYFSIDPL